MADGLMPLTVQQRAGRYLMKSIESDHDREGVQITHMPHLRGWIAAANWDRHLYSDPIATLASAKLTARRMLSERKK